MNLIRLYLQYISLSLRGQMQYKLSFAMQSVSLFLVTGTEFLALVFLFERFSSLRGWSLPEVALLYGLVGCSFAFSEAFARGFDIFDQMVKNGHFDRVLLRPRGTIFQVVAQEFQLMRIGRLSQAVVVLLWAMSAAEVEWTIPKVALVLWALFGGFCLFCGLFVLQAFVAFFSVESLEILNIFTYGGVETAQYPLSIYKPGFRLFFTFVVPLGCVSYLPGLFLLGRSDSYLLGLAPGAGVLFLLVCLWLWGFGVKKYTSTGS